jgi:predicted TPR repeat methyltransferase
MLKTALKHHQVGEAEEAEKLYRQLLEQDPNNTDVLHLLGILLAQRGEFLAAQKFIEKAIKLEPNSPSFYNSLGNVQKNLGNLNKAVLCYQKALNIDPNYAVAHNSLANIFLQQKKLNKALEHYNKALKLQPNYADAHYNLALILLKQDKIKEALQHLDEVLHLEPDHSEAHNQKAQLLHQEGRLDQAIYHYKECLKQDPVNIEAFHNLGIIFLERREPAVALKYFLRLLQLAPDFDTYYNLGVIYMDLGRTNDAIQYFNAALNKNPNHIATYINLGAIYLKAEDYIKAAEHYQRVLKLQPNNKEIAYILNAISQKQIPERAPKEYIQSLFDQYAPYFDKHLTEALDYKVPELLYKAVTAETKKVELNILDLGCGTGLVGEKFRPIAKKLIGVDIAEKMIAVAKQKNIYDKLDIIDLYKALQKYHGLDLIIAADTFVYIGKLDKIFYASKNALSSNGLFAFTTEKTEKYPYELQKSARFAHHNKYITELAKKNNFRVLRSDNIILRKQKNKSVEGYLYILVGAR